MMNLARIDIRSLMGPVRRILAFWRNPWVTGILSLIVFMAALGLVSHELSTHTPADLWAALDKLGPGRVFLAAICLVISFLGLTNNDRFALLLLNAPIETPRALSAAVAAHGLSKGLGYSWVTASSARQRLYRRWGISPQDIGTLSSLTMVMGQVAAITLAGLALWAGGALDFVSRAGLPAFFLNSLGLMCLLPIIGLALYWRLGPEIVSFGASKIYKPPLKVFVRHIAGMGLDRIGAALALYILLPNHGGWSLAGFLAVFSLAGLLGSASGAPAGLGVFDAIIIALVPVENGAPGAAVALLIYRGLFTLLPLLVAAVILAWDQWHSVRAPAQRVARILGINGPSIRAQVQAVLVFFAGAILLLSAALPTARAQFASFPVETSKAALIFGPLSNFAHLCAGPLAMILMALASPLWFIRKRARFYAVTALIFGALLSILKGLDYFEAAVMLAIGAYILWAPRRALNANPAPFAMEAGSGHRLLLILAASWVSALAVARFSDGRAIFFNFALWHDPQAGTDSARAIILAGATLGVLFLARIFAPKTPAAIDNMVSLTHLDLSVPWNRLAVFSDRWTAHPLQDLDDGDEGAINILVRAQDRQIYGLCLPLIDNSSPVLSGLEQFFTTTIATDNSPILIGADQHLANIAARSGLSVHQEGALVTIHPAPKRKKTPQDMDEDVLLCANCGPAQIADGNHVGFYKITTNANEAIVTFNLLLASGQSNIAILLPNEDSLINFDKTADHDQYLAFLACLQAAILKAFAAGQSLSLLLDDDGQGSGQSLVPLFAEMDELGLVFGTDVATIEKVAESCGALVDASLCYSILRSPRPAWTWLDIVKAIQNTNTDQVLTATRIN